KRDKTRPGHVLDALRIGHVLGPDLSLRPEHVLRLLGGELLRYRLVRVDVLERVVTADPRRLGGELRLRVVEVRRPLRGHDHIMAGLRRGDPALLATPAHHRRARCETALENLVPTHKAPPALGEPGIEMPDEPRLELVLVPEALLLDALLCRRCLAPLGLRALVAAHVDELRWKKVEHLFKDVFEEAE